MNFGDAIWWACVTVHERWLRRLQRPVTVAGRLVGGVLMFGGLALVGVITATVAAWIITLTSADSVEPKVVPMEETINAALAKAEASKAGSSPATGDDGSVPAAGSVGDMATVANILESLDERYPVALAEDWDVNGLTIGLPSAEVTRVHFAVDPTLAVAREAIAYGAQLLVTHHPLMLRGVTTVAADTAKGAVVQVLAEAGVALANFHTGADAAADGVADALARAVGVEPAAPLIPNAEDPTLGTGRVGNLAAPTTLGEFADAVAQSLPKTAQGVRIAGDLDAKVLTVAVVGGSGDGFLRRRASVGRRCVPHRRPPSPPSSRCPRTRAARRRPPVPRGRGPLRV